ncbi:MAG: trypsin-like peptidase domain-containing protein, partial [Bacteroidales bacterium]|nr:trypsin-like peptidase domain-containing protein [Bacteroidales bacterium]
MKYKHVLISFFGGIIGAVIAVLIIDLYKTSSESEIKNQHSLVADYYLNKQHQLPATRVANPFLFSPSSSFDFTSAAEMSVPAVVHVKTQYSQPNYTLYDFIFGTSPRYSTPVLTSGSGVIVSPDGYIVTNNHVVEDAETIEVVLNNKKSYSAKLVGRDA